MKNYLRLSGLLIFLLTGITFKVQSQTNVSGGIYTNTTWTLANSPYIVVDTVVVFPGITLTIEPGVVVKFENSKQLEIRQATLIAIGTSSDSITFTSNSPLPSPGIWANLKFNQSNPSKFWYCNFRYAANAIYIQGDSLTIKNSNFRFNNTGLGLVYSTNTLVDSCVFKDNITGINEGTGRIRMSNSIVTNNQNGILSPENSTYIHCIIDSNTVFGIGTQQLDSVIDCEIKYNGVGLAIGSSGGGSSSYFYRNIIEYNITGIQLTHINDQIFCNKICNNTTYDLIANTTLNTNCLINNYWCTTDSATIASHIYDGYDNVSLGLVTFMPIDTSQCYLNGCNLTISVNITNSTCDTCHDGSAKAFIGNGYPPYTYTWYTSPIQTTKTATGLASGTYTICVSDGNGCTACTSVFVDSTNCTGFSISTIASNSTCLTCSDGSATVGVNGGTAPYSYTWYTSPMQSTSTASGLLQGTYAVCVTDLNGCSACDSAIIATGNCSAHFNLYPDTILHHYYAINMASGVPPLTYYWSWGDSTYDSIPFPNHTYSSAGFYTICLTITDSVGCSNSYCNPFYLQLMPNAIIYVNVIPDVTGLNENSVSNSILIYPNPAHDLLEVRGKEKIDRLTITDTFGRICMNENNLTTSQIKLHVASLSHGVYFIRVTTGRQTLSKKIIIQ